MFGRQRITLDEVVVALHSWELEMKPYSENDKNGEYLNVRGRYKERIHNIGASPDLSPRMERKIIVYL